MCVVHVKYCNCNHLLAVDMAGVACRGLCMLVVEKSNDIGMGVRKLLWCHLFLPCLVSFWGFYPYTSFHF